MRFFLKREKKGTEIMSSSYKKVNKLYSGNLWRSVFGQEKCENEKMVAVRKLFWRLSKFKANKRTKFWPYRDPRHALCWIQWILDITSHKLALEEHFRTWTEIMGPNEMCQVSIKLQKWKLLLQGITIFVLLIFCV